MNFTKLSLDCRLVYNIEYRPGSSMIPFHKGRIGFCTNLASACIYSFSAAIYIFSAAVYIDAFIYTFDSSFLYCLYKLKYLKQKQVINSVKYK